MCVFLKTRIECNFPDYVAPYLRQKITVDDCLVSHLTSLDCISDSPFRTPPPVTSLFLQIAAAVFLPSLYHNFAYTHLCIQSYFRCSYPVSFHPSVECFPPNFPETIFSRPFMLPFVCYFFLLVSFCTYYCSTLIDYLFPFLQYFLHVHSTAFHISSRSAMENHDHFT